LSAARHPAGASLGMRILRDSEDALASSHGGRARTRARTVASASAKHRASIRSLIEEAKNVLCADCGGGYPTCAMDLDHVHGAKEFKVSEAVQRCYGLVFERVRAEIAKCEVVCANCHRIRTEQSGYTARPNPARRLFRHHALSASGTSPRRGVSPTFRLARLQQRRTTRPSPAPPHPERAGGSRRRERPGPCAPGRRDPRSDRAARARRADRRRRLRR
jgi:hypothetical protein